MMRSAVMVATLVTGLVGCAAAPADSLAAIEPALAIERDVVNCSDEEAEFYGNASFYAGTAITEALGEYENDPHNPVAERYFGVADNTAAVRAILTDMADIAYNREITYSCEGTDAPECKEETSLLWVLSGASMSGDYTIHTCGRRLFESMYVGDNDRDDKVTRVGAIVHEISHLAGTWVDNGYGEQYVKNVASSENAYYSAWVAEAYRFYVMNINAE